MTSSKIRKLAHTQRRGFNKYDPNELIGQAIKLFEEEQFGTGPDGHEIADKLRDIARKAFPVWQRRER